MEVVPLKRGAGETTVLGQAQEPKGSADFPDSTLKSERLAGGSLEGTLA